MSPKHGGCWRKKSRTRVKSGLAASTERLTAEQLIETYRQNPMGLAAEHAENPEQIIKGV